jgi:hypothetical protein
MRKGPGSVNDKWNIFVVICDTDIPQTVNQVIKIVSIMCTTIGYSNWTPDCAEIDISHLSQFPAARKIGLIKYNPRKL